MKEITRLMINEYRLKDIDFMGYYFTKKTASYHHLIIPKRLNGPETIENGAVLNKITSHPYLHIIEHTEYDMFIAITQEIIDEKNLGRLNKANLRRIRDILRCFEEEHKDDVTSRRRHLIRPVFVRGRIDI